MNSTLGDFIRDRRLTLGLNQTELAERCDLPRTTINRLESGKTQLPSADFRRRLAKGLGVSHLELLIAAGEIEERELQPDQVLTREVFDRIPKDVQYALLNTIWDPVSKAAILSFLTYGVQGIRDAAYRDVGMELPDAIPNAKRIRFGALPESTRLKLQGQRAAEDGGDFADDEEVWVMPNFEER